MIELRVCIDVDELDKGIAFYTQGLGLKLGRRFGDKGAELLGASSLIDILAKPAGSPASPGSSSLRDYRRHWTPVHLDFVVTDPFGHGLCLLQFKGRGYDEVSGS